MTTSPETGVSAWIGDVRYRTPLTTLKGRAQMLRRRVRQIPLDPDELGEGLARIDSGAAKMTVLISEQI